MLIHLINSYYINRDHVTRFELINRKKKDDVFVKGVCLYQLTIWFIDGSSPYSELLRTPADVARILHDLTDYN